MADSFVAPTTTEKKTRARSVFGDVVANDETESLSYSPSPTWKATTQAKTKALPDLSGFLDDQLRQNQSYHSCSTANPFDSVLVDEKENPDSEDKGNSSIMCSDNHELMMKTRDAVAKAKSVKQSSGKSRTHKKVVPLRHHQGKSVIEDTSTRKQQTLEAKSISERINEERREAIQMESQLSFQLRRRRAQKVASERHKRLQIIEEETNFKSEVYRKHKEALREAEETRRRQSVAARARQRENHKAGEDCMQKETKEQDEAILQQRHEASVAIRQMKSEKMRERRQSYQFRAGDAQRIRKLHTAMESEQLKREHESFELKWKDDADVIAYKQKLQRERRDSLAHRNMSARQQREHSKAEMMTNKAKDHDSFELKWAGEKDSEAYQCELAMRRRESLAFRGQEALVNRGKAMQSQRLEKKKEHDSYELKWEGERDSKAYVDNLERLRRESLVGRREESIRHKKSMNELRALAREKENESFILNWAAENDSKEYLSKIAAERRKSLKLRGRQIVHRRQVETSDQQKAVLQSHFDEELRATDYREKIAYQKACADRDRKSLEFRRTEACIRRVEEETKKVEERQKEEELLALESKAREDVADYLADCKRRRRYSLAFRAKESQRHMRWKREQHMKTLDETNMRVHDRLMDEKYTELAKARERKERVQKLLLHAGCSLNSAQLNES